MTSFEEKRALYSLLRMHWMNDPSMPIKSWQVEDYRSLPLPTLFKKLASFEIHLDEKSFTIYADHCDTPEQLTEDLIGDRTLDGETEDHIYLVVFELWRRLMYHSPSLTIFCDELDHLIFLYDAEKLEQPTHLQDAIAKILTILNENLDEGIDPNEAFQRLSECCANDLETFLYDFIADQIELEHESYSQDLLDGFSPFLKANKWFSLLNAKFTSLSNPKLAQKQFLEIIDNDKEENLEFNLEFLSHLSKLGMPDLFFNVLQRTLPQIVTDEDFMDLLLICIEYFHFQDEEQNEHQLQKLFDKRYKNTSSTAPQNVNVDFDVFLKIVKPQKG